MTHDELRESAKQALNAVFGDRSVGPSTTIEALEELAGDIEVMVDALRSDIRRES